MCTALSARMCRIVIKVPSVPNCPLALAAAIVGSSNKTEQSRVACSVRQESGRISRSSQSAVIAITTGTVYVQPEVLGGVV